MATLPDVYGRRPTPQFRGQVVGVSGESQTARAIAGLAGQVADIGERAQQQQDVAAISAARRQMDDWERRALFDPETGAINKRGQDSFNLQDGLQKDFDDAARKVLSGLTAAQRRAFQPVADGRRAQVLDWASKHTLRERESYEEGQYQADVKSFADRAALFPEKAPAEIAMLQQRTIGYLRGKGRSTEEINQALAENRDKAHAGVLSSLLATQQDELAAKYLQDNLAGMSPEVAARATKQVQESAFLTQAQGNADALVGAGLTMAQAVEQTRAKFKGRGEEVAVAELKTRFAEAETARIQQVRQVSNAAWAKVIESRSIKAVPPDVMATLEAVAPEEKRQMIDWLQSKADQDLARARGKFEPDTNLYIGLRRMATEEPDKFSSVLLERHAPKLSDGQLNSLLTLQGSISRADAKAMSLNKVVQDTVRFADAQIRQAGLKSSAKPGSKDAEEFASFKAALTEELDAAMEQSKAPLDAKQAQAIAMRMLRQEIEQGSGVGGFFQTTKRGYQQEAGKPYVAARFDDIPEAQRQGIIGAYLRKGGPNGGPVTPGGPRGSLSPDQRAIIERKYTEWLDAQGR